jgi:glycosyltransferase involved in cell wall biosynthesis
MAIMFLTPPFRRPYELYYFCNLTKDVIIVIDNDSFNRYSDYFDNEFAALDYQYFSVPIKKTGLGNFLNFGSTAALVTYDDFHLSKIIRDKKITTIVTVEAFSSISAQASRLSSKFSLKHIVIVWDNMKRSPFVFIPPFSNNTKIVRSTASKFIAVSSKSQEALISLKISEDKIEKVYPGIFVNKFRLSADNADRILFVGALEPHKGINILLQAFKKLSTISDMISSDLTLTVVGKGSLEHEIIKLRDSGLRIEHKGYIAHSELPEVYSGCSIFCAPSVEFRKAGLIPIVQEQFGFALVEAMACGLPVIASNIGSIPEIIGTDNLAVSPTVRSVYDAIYTLLTRDELRRGLRCKNRKRTASKFNAFTQSHLFEKAIPM